ncbi:hypothetical protein MTBBW1_10094 [Desulfamplus magnetovallimortis]|uniref:Uncharacterized protein n=1 Tax=Desulfamplus magnetovallimortis TaxID=1246637 RepID=A0A1W1H4X1_9BACT|nr:hypothetical protein MTBBW1_10094 [Desulfamplus magnetovallimortis]
MELSERYARRYLKQKASGIKLLNPSTMKTLTESVSSSKCQEISFKILKDAAKSYVFKQSTNQKNQAYIHNTAVHYSGWPCGNILH